MADPRGFLKFDRYENKGRPLDERRHDWQEVYGGLPTPVVQRQALRCMDCGVPFCQSNNGCPVDNLIPEWNDLVSRGLWREALERLHATNNFPEFTGRLCPAPCEAACVLNLHSDAVTIKSIERTIIDRGFEEGWVRPLPAEFRTGRRVAIIGSGPAGLAAAQQLARMGHDVTVFEKAPRIGGLLRYGIPDFKMEKSLIDRRMQQMSEEGVVFKTSICVGRDIMPEQLLRDFDAIGLAIGAEQARDLQVPGRELAGVHFAMDYLSEQNRVVSGEATGQFSDLARIDAAGKNVVIIGGGDTGSDCLGTAIRQGAKKILQFEIMPRPPQSRAADNPWPYWPMIMRSSHAHDEGGMREWSLSTKMFVGENGQVKKLIAERVQRVGSRFEPIPDSTMEFDADLVLLAMGFTGPVTEPLLSSLGVARDARGNVAADPSGCTTNPKIFAAGDVRRGASLIVWAIAEGRRMASSIDQVLQARATSAVSL